MKAAAIAVGVVAVVGVGGGVFLLSRSKSKAKPSGTPGTSPQAIQSAQQTLVNSGFVGASDQDVKQIVDRLDDGSGWRYHGSVYG
jgi:lysozyme family protein